MTSHGILKKKVDQKYWKKMMKDLGRSLQLRSAWVQGYYCRSVFSYAKNSRFLINSLTKFVLALSLCCKVVHVASFASVITCQTSIFSYCLNGETSKSMLNISIIFLKLTEFYNIALWKFFLYSRKVSRLFWQFLLLRITGHTSGILTFLLLWSQQAVELTWV